MLLKIFSIKFYLEIYNLRMVTTDLNMNSNSSSNHEKKKFRIKKKNLIKTEAVRKFETTSHGIPRIFKSKHWFLN